MKKSAKGLTKGAIAAIISISAAAVIICALFVVNLFFPLKYISAYFVSGSRSEKDGVYFHFLDVGQADSAVVELPDGKVMLIDGGDGAYTNTLKILKTLNKLDADDIDYMVCTSVNAEHCGGLADIISAKNVKTIYYPYSSNIYINDDYYKFYTAAKKSGADMVISEYGAGAQGGEGDGEYFFTFLSPSVHDNPSGEYEAMNSSPTANNTNNASAVLWIEYCGQGVLYAGDVTTSVLDAMAENYLFYSDNGLGSYFVYEGKGIDLSDCVLYKAANHGDYDSLSTAFTDLLSPQYSVISVGENNAADCPSVHVMADLQQYGELLITLYTGDITIKLDGAAAVL